MTKLIRKYFRTMQHIVDQVERFAFNFDTDPIILDMIRGGLSFTQGGPYSLIVEVRADKNIRVRVFRHDKNGQKQKETLQTYEFDNEDVIGVSELIVKTIISGGYTA